MFRLGLTTCTTSIVVLYGLSNQQAITNTYRNVLINATNNNNVSLTYLLKIYKQAQFVYNNSNITLQSLHLNKNMITNQIKPLKHHVMDSDLTMTNCGISALGILPKITTQFNTNMSVNQMINRFESNHHLSHTDTFLITHIRIETSLWSLLNPFTAFKTHGHAFIIHKLDYNHYTIFQSNQDDVTYHEGLVNTQIYSHLEIIKILNSYQSELNKGYEINQPFFKNQSKHLLQMDRVKSYHFN